MREIKATRIQLKDTLTSLVNADEGQLQLELGILRRTNPGPAVDLLTVAIQRLRELV